MKEMGEKNVRRFYETLAKIIGEREGVDIKVTVRRREDVENENKSNEKSVV